MSISKGERHAWRRAVRICYLIDRLTLVKLSAVHSRIVMAEMRKRKFFYQAEASIWRNPAMLPGALIERKRRHGL